MPEVLSHYFGLVLKSVSEYLGKTSVLDIRNLVFVQSIDKKNGLSVPRSRHRVPRIALTLLTSASARFKRLAEPPDCTF
jgi:hypothetical protein